LAWSLLSFRKNPDIVKMGNQAISTNTTFDFDSWMKLAKDDPATFERRKQAAIDAFFSQLSPEQQTKLRHLQWQIDMEIRRSSSPLGSCIKLNRLMMDSLAKQKAALDFLLSPEVAKSNPFAPQKKSGKVIPFESRNQS